MNIFFRVYQVIGDSKTNHDFGFDNNNNNKKNKIGCQRCYKCKEKPFEGGTLSCYESFLPKAQCKIFHNNSIKEMKFSMSIQGKLCHNCFPAHCKCINFSLDGVPVQDFFSYPYALAGYFFSKSPSPNPLFQTPKYMHHLKKPVLSAGYDRELTFSFPECCFCWLGSIFYKVFAKN